MAGEMHKYETIFIARPDLTEEAFTELVEKFNKLINDYGKVESVDDWGIKKLAYAIDFLSEGHYVLINFEAPVDFPSELERIYNITDGIMRSIIVNKDEK